MLDASVFDAICPVSAINSLCTVFVMEDWEIIGDPLRLKL